MSNQKNTSYPNFGPIISSVTCNLLGKEMKWGGLQRTDRNTSPLATLLCWSDTVYENESFPKNPSKGVYR
jgi:hypothetical protein